MFAKEEWPTIRRLIFVVAIGTGIGCAIGIVTAVLAMHALYDAPASARPASDGE